MYFCKRHKISYVILSHPFKRQSYVVLMEVSDKPGCLQCSRLLSGFFLLLILIILGKFAYVVSFVYHQERIHLNLARLSKTPTYARQSIWCWGHFFLEGGECSHNRAITAQWDHFMKAEVCCTK